MMDVDEEVPVIQAAQQEDVSNAASTSKPSVSLSLDEDKISESAISPSEDACVNIVKINFPNYGNTTNAASDTSETSCDTNSNTFQNALSPKLMTDLREESTGGQGLSPSDSKLTDNFAIKSMDVDKDMPDVTFTKTLEKIQDAMQELNAIESDVHTLQGTTTDKEYKILKRELNFLVASLGKLEMKHSNEVIEKHKMALKFGQDLIQQLERSATSNGLKELSLLLEELTSQVEKFDDVSNSEVHGIILALIAKISDILERARDSDGANKDVIENAELTLRMQKDTLDEKMKEIEQTHTDVSSEYGEPDVKFGEYFDSMQRESVTKCIEIIENTMKNYDVLKLKVEEFKGSADDDTYNLLVISLQSIMQSLEQIEMREAYEVRETHEQALGSVRDLLRQLQDQAKASSKNLSTETAQFLRNYKKDLEEIETMVENFDHIKDSDFYKEISSKIQNMNSKLEKVRKDGSVKPDVLSKIQSKLQYSEEILMERADIREQKEGERQKKSNFTYRAIGMSLCF